MWPGVNKSRLTSDGECSSGCIALESFNLDKAEFEKRHPVPNDAWERDTISADAYLEETVFYEPRSFSIDDFIAAICTAC